MYNFNKHYNIFMKLLKIRVHKKAQKPCGGDLEMREGIVWEGTGAAGAWSL